MGTRSRIAIRCADNTYLSVYCHWDGYPSHVGVTLQKYYDTEQKVCALLAGGDFSSLKANVADIEFYNKQPGEPLSLAAISPDLDALCELTQDTGGEWLYVFTPAGWQCELTQDTGGERLYVFTPAGWQCAPGGFSAFGMPSTEKPEGLESVDYWLQREAHDNG